MPSPTVCGREPSRIKFVKHRRTQTIGMRYDYDNDNYNRFFLSNTRLPDSDVTAVIVRLVFRCKRLHGRQPTANLVRVEKLT